MLPSLPAMLDSVKSDGQTTYGWAMVRMRWLLGVVCASEEVTMLMLSYVYTRRVDGRMT